MNRISTIYIFTLSSLYVLLGFGPLASVFGWFADLFAPYLLLFPRTPPYFNPISTCLGCFDPWHNYLPLALVSGIAGLIGYYALKKVNQKDRKGLIILNIFLILGVAFLIWNFYYTKNPAVLVSDFIKLGLFFLAYLDIKIVFKNKQVKERT